MHKTNAFEIIESFESSFQDKCVIPFELEMVWLEKAISRFSVELDPLTFDAEILEFDAELDRYVIDTLASFMKQYYMEREVSKVNKRISIVGKDLSWDASGNSKKYVKDELDYAESMSIDMISNQKPTAYN